MNLVNNNNLRHRKLCEFTVESANNSNTNIHHKNDNAVNFSPNLNLNKSIMIIIFIRFLFEFI